jgi:hypothetical protein
MNHLKMTSGHLFSAYFLFVCTQIIIGAIIIKPAFADLAPPEIVINSPKQTERNMQISFKEYVLIGIGDSMTHGSMDITLNEINTKNAYLQKVADSLGTVAEVSFSQPFFDIEGNRTSPFAIPTNLGIQTSDIFSLEGKQYYKRADSHTTSLSGKLFCNKIFPFRLSTLYDKVLYPINLLSMRPMSQMDAAVWLLNQVARTNGNSKAIVIFWVGNMEAGIASIGLGGTNPLFIPLPLDLIRDKLSPALNSVLTTALKTGAVSLEPYLSSSIQRNLTDTQDFKVQLNSVLDRFENDVSDFYDHSELFICTFPYFSSAGYLLHSEDIEYYLKKIDPDYTVPSSFKRIVPAGEPIIDHSKGDRVSLFSFLCMYILLSQDSSIEYINQVLETDAFVMSEQEYGLIVSRIDSLNAEIIEAVSSRTSSIHLIDTGKYFNDMLTGKSTLTVEGVKFGREWARGNTFSFDGVHPGYTSSGFIANFILQHINETIGLDAPLFDLKEIMAHDPYVDRDGDGWMPGPDYSAPGLTELAFFFKDPDDNNVMIQPELPPDIWSKISATLLEKILSGDMF